MRVTSSPHVRDSLTTGQVMYDVILALMPATFFGVYHFGFQAFMVLAVSVLSAVVTEFVFDYIAGRPNTIADGSAVVTGLLLGLCLSPTVPLYVPYVGSLFAILVAKCAFGGLGQNFMNPALAGRCFLLISFGGAMTNYNVDGVSGATPLAVLSSGGSVNVTDMLLGFTSGTIGVSCVAMLIGGIYLLVTGGITWEIPVSYIVTFLLCIGVSNGNMNPVFLLAEVCGGGILLGAIFMATDPVTSPMTSHGQIIFGVCLGVLTAVFRTYGTAAESVSFAIIICNLLVPVIDRIALPKPFGITNREKSVDTAALKPLAAIAAVGVVVLVCLGFATKGTIEANRLAANSAAYQEVLPEYAKLGFAEGVTVDSSAVYGGGAYGNAYINEAVVASDESGNALGYGISVTTTDSFEDSLILVVGILPDGTVQGISFTDLHETDGMGMRCGEEDWKAQFAGVKTDSFTLNKNGDSTADNDIDTVSGASTTSGAVVNAVNAAIDFYVNEMS